MGFPILTQWSLKRSGAAMTLTAVDADGKLVKLTVVDVRRDDGTVGITLATVDGGGVFELR